MITDSKGIKWTQGSDKSTWTSSSGFKVFINPNAAEEQVITGINSLYDPQPVQKTDAERIAELEAKIAELLSKS